MATTRTCPRSAGGRRTAAARSSPTTQATRGARAAGVRRARLLYTDGASRANILSGDATRAPADHEHRAQAAARAGSARLDAYFASPYNVARTLLALVRARWSARWRRPEQRRKDVRPSDRARLAIRGRAGVGDASMQRDLQVEAVARRHPGGTARQSTRRSWPTTRSRTTPASSARTRSRRCAASTARSRRIAARPTAAALPDRRPRRPRPVAGRDVPPALRLRLEELVRKAAEADAVGGERRRRRARLLGAALTEAAGATARPRALRGRPGAHRRRRGRLEHGERPGARRRDVPELVVMASGCLGLVTFPREPGRVTLEGLERALAGRCCRRSRAPRRRLRARALRGRRRGRARRRRHRLADGTASRARTRWRRSGPTRRATWAAPTASRTARTSSSTAATGPTREVAAFEELVGSHGGMGGAQSYPFVLHPGDLALPEEELVGAEAVHRSSAVARRARPPRVRRGAARAVTTAAAPSTMGGNKKKKKKKKKKKNKKADPGRAAI